MLLSVNITAVADSYDDHLKHAVANFVDHPIIADPDSPCVTSFFLTSAGRGFDSKSESRFRILG
jgi:hypothetical protein